MRLLSLFLGYFAGLALYAQASAADTDRTVDRLAGREDISNPNDRIGDRWNSVSPSGPPVPGDILICPQQNLEGDCAIVHAYHQCANLPQSVNRKNKSLAQFKGVQCEYYMTDNCYGISAFTLKSPDSLLYLGEMLDFEEWVGSVKCSKLDASKGQAEALIGRAWNSTLATDPPQPGDVLICSQHHLQENCVVVHAFEQCVNVPQPVYRKNKSLTQFKGVHCVYWNSDNCQGEAEFTLNTLESLLYLDEMLVFEWWVASVKCWVPKNNLADSNPQIDVRASVVQNNVSETETGVSATMSPSTRNATNNRDTAADLTPGTITHCDDVDLRGHCRTIDIWNMCEAKFDPKFARSIRQEAGALCKYYRRQDCFEGSDGVFELDTSAGARWVPTFGTYYVRSISCGPAAQMKQPAEGASNTTDAPTLQHGDEDWPDDHPMHGTVTVCGSPNARECHTYWAYNRCKEIPPKVAGGGVEWFDQFQGVHCAWYNAHYCDKGIDFAPMWVDSTGGTVRRENLGQNGELYYRSVECMDEVKKLHHPRVHQQKRSLDEGPDLDEEPSLAEEPYFTEPVLENGPPWDFKPGKVTVCATSDLRKYCLDVFASSFCVDFPPKIGGIESIYQWYGATCEWYTGHGCKNKEGTDDKPAVVKSEHFPVVLKGRWRKYHDAYFRSVICTAF